MAHQFTNHIETVKTLASFQSFCDFNLFWLYSIAPEVVLHIETIRFLSENAKHLKRKLSIKELLNYDLIIGIKHPETFEDFKNEILKFNEKMQKLPKTRQM
jgi:hypothetical protein